ncbi:MAG: DoxX family protein [Actinomycetota bacterium]
MVFEGLAEFAEWGFLALRIAVGVIFIWHGWPKITGARGMAAAMGGGEAKPALVGMVTIQGVVEAGGGVLMILGVLTQLVALAFIIIMIGAIALKNTMWKTGFMSQQTTGWEFDLVLLAANLLLFLAGPGEIAIQS